MGLELGHQDDSVRAVVASLYIKEQLEQINIRSRQTRITFPKLTTLYSVGITSGRTFCGSYGNTIRHDYSVIGKTVNLASRLMTFSRDDILCDQDTFEACKEKISFDEFPQIIHLKGIDQEIKAYKPLKFLDPNYARIHHPHINSHTSFIGRIKEKGSVGDILQKLKMKSPKVLPSILIGDFKLPKPIDPSRLASETTPRILVIQGEGKQRIY